MRVRNTSPKTTLPSATARNLPVAPHRSETRAWSRARWGKELTNRYFEDLHEGAQYIAENHASLRNRQELAGGTAPIGNTGVVACPMGQGVDEPLFRRSA